MEFSINDIAHSAKTRSIDFGATLPQHELVLSGKRERQELDDGLAINLQDSQALRDFETRALLKDGLVMHMIIKGNLKFSFAGIWHSILHEEHDPAQIYLCALSSQQEFIRRTKAGTHLKKISVSISWNWLARHHISPKLVLRNADWRFCKWVAPLALVVQSLALFETTNDRSTSQVLKNVSKESVAILMVQSLLEHSQEHTPLTPSQKDQLSRMEHFATRPGPLPDLKEIARQGNMSVSSMHRLFTRAYGKSAHTHLREIRFLDAVESLRNGASIAQAASIAGYGSANTFSTVFHKKLGFPPSKL